MQHCSYLSDLGLGWGGGKGSPRPLHTGSAALEQQNQCVCVGGLDAPHQFCYSRAATVLGQLVKCNSIQGSLEPCLHELSPRPLSNYELDWKSLVETNG